MLGHLREARAVLRTALDAVAGLPARVLMTVGRVIDPADLLPAALNVHIERWVPQRDVFAQARLVVCHGGSGTTFGALAAGLPLVVCPLFADQSANGRLVERAGAGVVLSSRERAGGGVASLGPGDVTPLRDAIETVLADPTRASVARRIATEIAREPTLEDTFAKLLSDNSRTGGRCSARA